jgi:hypothetical protein
MNENELQDLHLRVGRSEAEMMRRLEVLRKAAYQPGKTFEQAQASRDSLAREAREMLDTLYQSFSELVSAYQEQHIDPAKAKKLEIW